MKRYNTKNEDTLRSNSSDESRITDPALAEHMAYGEKPYRELGIEAVKLGFVSEARDFVAKADKAGLVAGQAYIDDLQENLQAQLDGHPVVPAETKALLEREAASIIEALEVKYPGYNFARIGDTVMCTDAVGIHFDELGIDSSEQFIADMVNHEEDDRFMVTIDGTRYDTRDGMTDEAYKALVYADLAAGRATPDVRPIEQRYGVCTLFVKKFPDGTEYLSASHTLPGGIVLNVTANSNQDLRFRPAVKLSA